MERGGGGGEGSEGKRSERVRGGVRGGNEA